MTPVRIIGLVILALGAVLLILGITATDSLGESFRHAFTGQYSERTTWYIASGIVALVIGGAMALWGGMHRHLHDSGTTHYHDDRGHPVA